MNSQVQAHLEPVSLQDPINDYSSLLNAIGDARIVCIGDATHGTFEFYNERAKITKLLIIQKGFNTISVEADWPDGSAIHRYIHGSLGLEDAFNAFTRFPKWMWRNEVMLEFSQWLKEVFFIL
jgi:erythromycin esterase-like protein